MSGIVGSPGTRSGVLGIQVEPQQPAFACYKGSNQTSPADGADITWDTEYFNQVANYFSSPTFFAPVDGKYQFNFSLRFYDVDEKTTHIAIEIISTGPDGTQTVGIWSGSGSDANLTHLSINVPMLIYLDSGDTVKLRIDWAVSAGGVAPGNINANSYFSGYLVS